MVKNVLCLAFKQKRREKILSFQQLSYLARRALIDRRVLELGTVTERGPHFEGEKYWKRKDTGQINILPKRSKSIHVLQIFPISPKNQKSKFAPIQRDTGTNCIN